MPVTYRQTRPTLNNGYWHQNTASLILVYFVSMSTIQKCCRTAPNTKAKLWWHHAAFSQMEECQAKSPSSAGSSWRFDSKVPRWLSPAPHLLLLKSGPAHSLSAVCGVVIETVGSAMYVCACNPVPFYAPYFLVTDRQLPGERLSSLKWKTTQQVRPKSAAHSILY